MTRGYTADMHTTRLSIGVGLLLGISLFVMAGCKAVIDTATGTSDANVGQSLNESAGALTRMELAQKLRRLAVSYLGEVPEACELIAAANPSLEQRVLALSIRVNSTDAVISMAADPDPQVSLLNMVTVLTLQRMLAEERAEEFFGDLGTHYVSAARRMEDEAWKLAAQVMDEPERQQLMELISQYRRDRPDEISVWWVRFSEFSAYKEQFSIAGLGQSVVDLFVPVGGAVSGIESTTDVAERATWLAARQALIVQWRVELIYVQTLSAPETGRLLSDIERVSATIDALPERIAAERKAILAAVDDQEAALGRLITQTREAIGDANSTVKEVSGIAKQVDETMLTAERTVGQVQATLDKADQSIESAKAILPETESALAQLDETGKTLTQTIQVLDTFVRQFDEEEPDPDRRPFDITDYTQAVQEAGKTVEQLNTLVGSLDQSAQPQRLDATLDAFVGRASELIWQACLAIVVAGLILITAAKLIPRRGSVKTATR